MISILKSLHPRCIFFLTYLVYCIYCYYNPGALASLIAQIVTTPLDVARTRMMIDDKSKNDNNNDNINNNDNHDNYDDNDPSSTTAMVMNKGIFNYVGYIGSTEGITALFVGLEPRIVRALLSGAIQFFTYELTQNALRS